MTAIQIIASLLSSPTRDDTMAAKARGTGRQPKPQKNPQKSAAILKAAEAIFARKGFHTATIAEIAKKAKVSEATIYEYFSTKEELLFDIPAEKISAYHEKDVEIIGYLHGAANKLRFLIVRHLELYDNDPDYANVAMLILKGNRNFLNTEAYQIVRKAARFYVEVLKEGVQSGEFRKDINPHLVRAMIWGTIEHTVIRRSLLGAPADLTALADDIYETIFQGIRRQPREPGFVLKLQPEDIGR
jgi:TetR/AcrR family fatty acid metabolism transcriptional regulator